jgi:Ca2+-binding RTX toxin-like protein
VLRFAVALVVVLSAAVLVVPSPAASAGPTCHGREATIVGTNGNDRIRGTGKRDVIVARAGNDRIWGLGGNDVICGDAGQDRLWGGGGDDRLEGGIGDFGEYNETWGGDYLMPGGGDDVLVPQPEGGAAADDADFLFLRDERGGVHLDLAAGTITGNGHDRIVNRSPELWVTGTPHDDVLKGTAGRDHLMGGRGGDRIVGRGGGDSLHPQSYTNAEAESDRPRDHNVIDGGEGDDVISGGLGRDDVDGGPGDDYLSSGHAGPDELRGGDGADRFGVHSSTDRVSVWGGPGDDDVRDRNRRSTVRGGDGHDVIRLEAPRNGVRSAYLGGQGEDTFAFHDARQGRDPMTLRTDLRDGAGSYAGGTFRLGGIDALEADSDVVGDRWIAHGTNEVESFTAEDRMAARIHAYGGDDVVRTGPRNDVVWGGDGVDTADTGAGEDVCHEVEAATNCESS